MEFHSIWIRLRFKASKSVIFYVIYLGIVIISQLAKNKLDDFYFDVIYKSDY